MATSTTETNTSSSTQSTEQRLAAVQNELATHAKHSNRATRQTQIVGLFLIVLMAGYFSYGYREFAQIMQPETLAAAGVQVLEDHLPDARKALEKEIIASSSTWAEQLSLQAQAAVPTVRGTLEDYSLKRTKDLVDKTLVITDAEFRKALTEHRETIEKGFEELATRETASDAMLTEIEAALNAQLGNDMKEQAAIVLETLTMLNDKLKKLQLGKGLTAEEQNERRALMTAKRLQLQQADSSLVGKELPKAVQPHDHQAGGEESPGETNDSQDSSNSGDDKTSETSKPEKAKDPAGVAKPSKTKSKDK